MSWHPHGHYLSLGKGQAHLVDHGQGPVALLLHGFLHSSWTWRAQIEELARDHRVIAPDLPGFGRTDAEHEDHSLEGLAGSLRALLKRLGVRRLALCAGNSLGGALACSLALDPSLAVERVALSNPYLLPLPLPSLGFRLLGLEPFAPLFRATAGNERFRRWALRAAAYGQVSGEVLAGFRHLDRPGSHRAACVTAAELARGVKSLRSRLKALRAPTLLAWGERDRLLAGRYGRRVEKLLPRARCVRFSHSGHCPHEEEPARFNALLRELLSRSSPAGS